MKKSKYISNIKIFFSYEVKSMSFFGKIKLKIISSSNSFKFYKENYEKLNEEIHKKETLIQVLKRENENLFKENENLNRINSNLTRVNESYSSIKDDIDNLNRNVSNNFNNLNNNNRELVKKIEYNHLNMSNDLKELISTGSSIKEDLNNKLE